MSARFTVEQFKISLLLALLGIHVLYSLFGVITGIQLIDEALYHWVTKSFAESGTFSIWTGYNEFPSIELLHHQFEIHSGKALSPTPAFIPIIGWPFYSLMGFRGLFLMNAVAYVAVVSACFLTAQRLFRDTNLSLNSCIIFVVCTFAWEYSQGAWPHMACLAFGIWSFYFAVRAYQGESVRQAVLFSLISGLFAGIVPGIRFDAILFLGCVAVIFLFSRPTRWLETVALVVGSLPGLATLTFLNYVKFGVLSPFYIGTSLLGYTREAPTGFLMVAAAAVAIAWVVTRECFRKVQERQMLLVVVALGGAAIVLAAVPHLRAALGEELRHAYELLVDIRYTDIHLRDPEMIRSAGGGMVYLGGHKKALLQSLPYLAMLAIPIMAILRRGRDWPELLMVAVTPLAFAGFFSHWNDKGGMCLNLRYLLPALPFTSMLTAWALRELDSGFEHTYRYIAGGLAAFSAFFVFFYFMNGFRTLDQQEFPQLVFPLLLASLLFLLIIAGFLLRERQPRLVFRLVFGITIFSLAWSSAVAFSYDAQLHRQRRIVNYEFGEELRRVVPNDSMIFVAFRLQDLVLSLIDADKVRIGFPQQDRFKDFSGIVAFHLRAGRRVFGVFPEYIWGGLAENHLSEYDTRTLFSGPDFRVAEITSRSE